MFETLTTHEQQELLSSQLIGRLACYADGQIYITPLSYAYTADGYIYIHTYEGKKLQMLRQNGALCFQVDDMKDLSNWKSVILWGKFEELTTPEDRAVALGVLSGRALPFISSETMHLSPHWPFGSDNQTSVGGIFFRIKITEMTGRCERINSQNYFAS